MKYLSIPVTNFQQNCSLIWCEKTHKAALIDPGGDAETLIRAINKQNVTLDKILLTHGHLDHVGATRIIADQFDVLVIGPQKEDAIWLDNLPQQAKMFGLPHIDPFSPDQWLTDNDEVKIGNITLKILHCPGHTPGHIIFFDAASNLAFVGDVLFKGSIGRTDFPQGDHASLIKSIKHKLLPLGDNVTFIPGHGPNSTLGHERKTNPHVI